MNGLRMCLTTLLFLLLYNSISSAGAWTQKRGGGYYKLGLRITVASEYYNQLGQNVKIPGYEEYTTSFYGEYGLLKRLTLIASIPFFKQINLDGQTDVVFGDFGYESNSGFADPEVGFRVNFLRVGASVLSSEILFGLPAGDETHSSGLLTGDGEFNQIFSLQFGQSLHSMHLYFSGKIGFNNRTEGFSDEWRYATEIGYFFHSKLLLNLKLRGVESRKNGNPYIIGSRSNANNQSYLLIAPELNYSINGSFGLSAAAERAAFTENAISGLTFSVGIFLQFPTRNN